MHDELGLGELHGIRRTHGRAEPAENAGVAVDDDQSRLPERWKAGPVTAERYEEVRSDSITLPAGATRGAAPFRAPQNR